MENITETQEINVPFESLTDLSGTLLNLSLSPCSTNVITNSELRVDNVIATNDEESTNFMEEEFRNLGVISSESKSDEDIEIIGLEDDITELETFTKNASAPTMVMITAPRKSILKTKNNQSSTKLTNKTTKKKCVRFDNSTTDSRETGSAYSLLPRSVAKISKRHHAKSRTGTSSTYVICKFCSKLIQKSLIKTHYMAFHSQDRPFAYNNCDNCLASLSGLNQPKSSHYYKKNNCPLCNRRFASKQTMFPEENPFKCSECKQRFTRKGNEDERHERMPGDYPCCIC